MHPKKMIGAGAIFVAMLMANSSVTTICVQTLGLKEQKVEMKFKQQCADVKSHKDIKKLSLSEATPEDTSIEEKDAEYKGVEPCFEDEESVRRMVEWAVNLHLCLVGRREWSPKKCMDYKPTPEHMDGLCEMCKCLGRLCVERK